MKIAKLMAAGAALAMIAAPAFAGPLINKGQYGANRTNTTNFVNAAVNWGRSVSSPSSQSIPSWHAVGLALNNDVAANMSAKGRYTLKGHVTKDCSLYSGTGQSSTLDFGQIGIYASDTTSPNDAFEMVAPAGVVITTNLAGCNTLNTVHLRKNHADGLINTSNGGGYDANVFQKNLPFSATAILQAPLQGQTTAGLQTVTAGVNDPYAAPGVFGAWKSQLALAVTIPVADKALLAGDYEGWVELELEAH